MGVTLTKRAISSGISDSKSITPGATLLTAISGAKALASPCVSMITPAFEAQYGTCLPHGRRPPSELTLTMLPPPERSISLAASWQQKNVALRFTS